MRLSPQRLPRLPPAWPLPRGRLGLGHLLWASLLVLGCSSRLAAPAAELPSGIGPAPGSEQTDTDKATVRCAQAGAANGPTAAPAGSTGATAPLPAVAHTGWLRAEGRRLLRADGAPFRGRGVNLACPRGCGACACNNISLADSAQEVVRRLDVLVDDWHVNFVRLHLESYAQGDTDVRHLPAYLDALGQIVAHVQTKPNLYLLLSIWFDPSLDAQGWPTEQTYGEWQTLVQKFGNVSQVLFGICNEPKKNGDGALDAQVWARMNAAAATIRDTEAQMGAPPHIIVAQGTGGWARHLAYYIAHPLTAAGGQNIAYETHVYDHADLFDARFGLPAKSLPVIIGEFGPLGDGSMTLADTQALMQLAERLEVPYLAWTFHGRCVPSLLVDASAGGCGLGMPLQPSQWGEQVKAQFSRRWGAEPAGS